MKTRGAGRLANRIALSLLVGCALTLGGAPSGATTGPERDGKRWGANYFPNVPLTTHQGETVLFYDDVIKDKVVALNFIFTSCKDVCPAETSRLRQVQNLLGDRMGQDVFFYSITIDPETDTPEVLASYREKFKAGPGWTFLTGKQEDIDLLQRKLGLLIDDLQDPNDHNVSLIVGNESTGRWMKRSPFDKPQVLASVIGDWLHNWTVARHGSQKASYAAAPVIEKYTQGERLWKSRCDACHTIGGGEDLGPDLLGVTEKRDHDWLVSWLKNPDELLEQGDPIAVELDAASGGITMPNLGLGDVDARALIQYLEEETQRARRAKASIHDAHQHH